MMDSSKPEVLSHVVCYGRIPIGEYHIKILIDTASKHPLPARLLLITGDGVNRQIETLQDISASRDELIALGEVLIQLKES